MAAHGRRRAAEPGRDAASAGQARDSATTTGAGTLRTDKRTAIVDAATQVFLVNGYDQSSMEAVALQAEVSKTTVYAHFGDKFGLLQAVAERAVTLLDLNLDQIILDKISPPEDKLARVVMTMVEAQTSDASLAFLRTMLSESGRHPELARVLGDRSEPHALAVVAGILAEDAARQGYRLRNPSALAALFMRMAAGGLQVDALMDIGFRPTRQFIEQHARWVTAVFLQGIRPGDGRLGERPLAPQEDYAHPGFPQPRS